MAQSEAGKFDEWAVVELFGHQKIAGRVTEQTIGGTAFVRVDVPAVNSQPEFTKLYGDKAIYSITPCSEEFARLAAARIRAEPVSVYVPELYPREEPRQLSAPSHNDDFVVDDGFGDDDEDDRPF